MLPLLLLLFCLAPVTFAVFDDTSYCGPAPSLTGFAFGVGQVDNKAFTVESTNHIWAQTLVVDQFATMVTAFKDSLIYRSTYNDVTGRVVGIEKFTKDSEAAQLNMIFPLNFDGKYLDASLYGYASTVSDGYDGGTNVIFKKRPLDTFDNQYLQANPYTRTKKCSKKIADCTITYDLSIGNFPLDIEHMGSIPTGEMPALFAGPTIDYMLHNHGPSQYYYHISYNDNVTSFFQTNTITQYSLDTSNPETDKVTLDMTPELDFRADRTCLWTGATYSNAYYGSNDTFLITATVYLKSIGSYPYQEPAIRVIVRNENNLASVVQNTTFEVGSLITFNPYSFNEMKVLGCGSDPSNATIAMAVWTTDDFFATLNDTNSELDSVYTWVFDIEDIVTNSNANLSFSGSSIETPNYLASLTFTPTPSTRAVLYASADLGFGQLQYDPTCGAITILPFMGGIPLNYYAIPPFDEFIDQFEVTVTELGKVVPDVSPATIFLEDVRSSTTTGLMVIDYRVMKKAGTDKFKSLSQLNTYEFNPCPPGYYASLSYAVPWKCTPCDNGYYSDRINVAQCSACPAGTYAEPFLYGLMQEFFEAPEFPYSIDEFNGPAPSAAICQACPPNMYTPNPGSYDFSSCQSCGSGGCAVGANSPSAPALTTPEYSNEIVPITTTVSEDEQSFGIVVQLWIFVGGFAICAALFGYTYFVAKFGSKSQWEKLQNQLLKCDIFFTMDHMVMENSAVRKLRNYWGGLLSIVAVVCILGLVLSAILKYTLDNDIQTRALLPGSTEIASQGQYEMEITFDGFSNVEAFQGFNPDQYFNPESVVYDTPVYGCPNTLEISIPRSISPPNGASTTCDPFFDPNCDPSKEASVKNEIVCSYGNNHVSVKWSCGPGCKLLDLQSTFKVIFPSSGSYTRSISYSVAATAFKSTKSESKKTLNVLNGDIPPHGSKNVFRGINSEDITRIDVSLTPAVIYEYGLKTGAGFELLNESVVRGQEVGSFNFSFVEEIDPSTNTSYINFIEGVGAVISAVTAPIHYQINIIEAGSVFDYIGSSLANVAGILMVLRGVLGFAEKKSGAGQDSHDKAIVQDFERARTLSVEKRPEDLPPAEPTLDALAAEPAPPPPSDDIEALPEPIVASDVEMTPQ